MAKKEKRESNGFSRRFERGLSTVSGVLDQLSTSLYGANLADETDRLNDKFNSVINQEISFMNDPNNADYSSFLGKLFNDDKQASNVIRELNGRLDLGAGDTLFTARQFITDEYQNRLIRQADAHQIAEQLIELGEAKSVMRDAILSADKTSGRIQRNIIFEKSTVNDADVDYTPAILAMEKHFDLQGKIKDFIVDQVLDYGEYYAYHIPYHEVFTQFSDKYKNRRVGGRNFFESADNDPLVESITEIPLFESTDDEFIKKLEGELTSTFSSEKGTRGYVESVSTVKADVKALGERITVTNGHIPLPITEYGLECMQMFRDNYVTESGDQLITEAAGREKSKNGKDKDLNKFLEKYGNSAYDGFIDKDKEGGEKFEEIKDCYIKLIEPTRLLPIKIMDQVLFYIYVQCEDDVPLTSILSYTNAQTNKDPTNKVTTLVDEIVSRIVMKFDSKFVKDNSEFYDLIVSALQYYDMGNKRIHFQVIPKEYITEFKINKDKDGHGTSMLAKSLFYAKLYLMILMFKIVTIITKSNDQEINYLRTSGIDKNVFNKAQEIARQKQARRVTLNDMFSYTGVLNKVAAGSSIFMPLGKNGEKPIETEVIQGQQVDMNNDFMEMLRTNYILGTGVPSAIMNYLNEADFAKSIETANTKMTGRVCSYQIDLNGDLTNFYRNLMRMSTNIPEDVINSVSIVLPEPKGSSNVAQRDNIDNYVSMQEFLVKMYFGEDGGDEKHIRRFTMELARMHLPMINFAEIDKVFETTRIEAVEDKLAPADSDPDYDEA